MRRRTSLRSLALTGVVIAAGALSGCGSASAPAAPPGSPENPLVAQAPEQESAPGQLNEASAQPREKPGYEKLLEEQTNNPKTRFTPCNLVTPRQARAILGAPIQDPVEAPQGPTCIYQTETGTSFVTIALQDRALGGLKKEMRRPEPLAVGDRRAYCGTHGQPTLHVSLGRGSVLSIAAPCSIAEKFAAKAVAGLAG